MRTFIVVVFVTWVAACGGGGSSGDSVQLTTTNLNPRVGETSHVGATLVDGHGVAIPGATCTFASNNDAFATVDRNNGTVTTHAAGKVTITATCNGISASVDLTVRDCRCFCDNGVQCMQNADCGVDANGIPNVCGCPVNC